jgi:hypothetical protein
MISLLYFILGILAAPFKSKSRLCQLAKQFIDAEMGLRRSAPKVLALATEPFEQPEGMELAVVFGVIGQNRLRQSRTVEPAPLAARLLGSNGGHDGRRKPHTRQENWRNRTR